MQFYTVIIIHWPNMICHQENEIATITFPVIGFSYYLYQSIGQAWCIHLVHKITTNNKNMKIPARHDDVIKCKHFPCYWPLVWGIHGPPVDSPHQGQWRGALMLSLISPWIYGWVKNREAGVFRRRRAHYDVTVMNCGMQLLMHA